jgi:hypothetical protein
MPHSRSQTARHTRSAFASVLLASAVGAALFGCSGSESAPPMEASPSPTVTSPVTAGETATRIPSPTPTGFDRGAVYAACNASVPTDVWGARDPLQPGPIVADSFGPAVSDGYTAQHTNGDPNAIYVNVQYFKGGVFQFSALCVASGEPAAPRVEFIRTLD